MATARVMIPMFWVGYLIQRYYERFKSSYMMIGIVSFVLYMVMMNFWKPENIEYYSGFPVKLQEIMSGVKGANRVLLQKLFYRLCVGILGSISVISLIHGIKPHYQVIGHIGASTMGIYIIQAFLLEDLLGTYMPELCIWISNIYMLWFVIVVFSCIMLALSYGVYYMLSRISILDLFLFGKINKKNNHEKINSKNS